ncbi:MAG: ABC transporter ATP-binding protein [Clostridium sp.]|uniref:ABC transporter ATP-binding protein n=1 Tax=Clostridium sp. TaxID=1506 RepID=UPI002A8677FC|nr:ABC transporter ATP-binding protein [Clostridium sp.]MDY5096997.1 ABC transporter ATP-binding protein [Clostridium sp.]
MGKVILKNINHSFGKTEVLHDINLEIQDGELFTLLGPSGCGKTTLLRIIAGFTKPVNGSVLLNEDDITALPPEKRNIGTVFQNYALFPNMNVEDNVLYGLKIRKLSKDDLNHRLKHYLDLVGMYEYRKRKISELSGGQQQRVALARSLAIEPNVLLLDEPMSNLDAALREKMREEIRNLQQKLKITTLFITHDQREALSISDKIAIIKDGRCIQQGTPEEIYNCPTDEFVANFVGESTILSKKEASMFGVDTEQDFLYVRPEKLKLIPIDSPLGIEGKILKKTFNGAIIEYKVSVSNNILSIVQLNDGHMKNVGDLVKVILANA